jgi:hypothetical protein
MGVTLIWNSEPSDPASLYETDFIRYLLRPTNERTIQHDKLVGTEDLSKEDVLVFTTSHPDQLAAGLPQISLTNEKIAVLHLSDTYVRANSLHSYPLEAKLIIRNYYVESLDKKPEVLFVPLGYQQCFWKLNRPALDAVPSKKIDRKHAWSFAGNTTHRQESLDKFKERVKVEGEVVSTRYWNDPEGLPIIKYRNLIMDSWFVPCFQAGPRTESFRVWETLEGGAIPIIEDNGELDKLVASSGFTRVAPWCRVPNHEWDQVDWVGWWEKKEEIRIKCLSWWQAYKIHLRKEIAKRLEEVK